MRGSSKTEPSNGTLYLLGESTGRTACQPGDMPISWNTAGVNSQDGVSVTSEQLAAGEDASCPAGGSRFTSADGVTYACNGGFTGVTTSPNGSYRISLGDAGIELHGPSGDIRLTDAGVVVRSATALTVDAGTTLGLDSSGSISMTGAGTVTIRGATVSIN